ncbi:nucleotide sugar transporter SLC35D2 isoform X1 [Podarcis muralis]
MPARPNPSGLRSALPGEAKAAPEGAPNSALARSFRGSARGRVAAAAAAEWVGTGRLAGWLAGHDLLPVWLGFLRRRRGCRAEWPGARVSPRDERQPRGEAGAGRFCRRRPFPSAPAAFRPLLRDLLFLHCPGQQGGADGLQMVTTILILYVSKLNRIIHFPDFDKSIPMKLFPLPLIYVGNHISGLSSTSKLSLPMFTVLRKFTIPLTLLLEVIVLGKRYSLSIVISVFAIILGAFIAAGSDLAFSMEGYASVLLNDVFTAANGVYTKQKIDPKELGKYGVIFYNACFMVIPTVLISFFSGDFQQATNFKEWTNVLFIFQFLLSCVLGFLLMYSTVLCSHYNSALTTTVVGAIKNVSIAYIGMLIGGDYIFSVLNFIGLNICMAGGLRYSFLTIRGNDSPKISTDEEKALPGAKS